MTSAAWYLVPGKYLLDSRLHSLPERLSWLLINPVVIGYLSVRLSDDASIGHSLVAAVVLWMSWQSVYETGYLENDVRTIRKETRPTLRFDRMRLRRLSDRLAMLVAGKVVVAVAWLAVAGQSAVGLGSIAIFLSVVLLMRGAFLVHNAVRSRWNVVTYFVLSTTKYAAIPLALAPASSRGAALAAAVLVFPLPRTLEHATKVKYGLTALHSVVQPVWRFRLVYYGALTVATGVVGLILDAAVWATVFEVSAYLFVVRLASGLMDVRTERAPHAAYVAEIDSEHPSCSKSQQSSL